MRIGTHDGHFQADDVLALAILSKIYPLYELVRSRDARELATCDIVVDVGNIYDPTTHRFDHHQRERAGARSTGVLYSSAGLVWKHYRERVCDRPDVCERIDADLISAVDASDNGQALYSGGTAIYPGVSGYSLSRVIAAMNPVGSATPGESTTAFLAAMRIMGTLLDAELARARWTLDSAAHVRTAMASATDPRVITLAVGAPWKEIVVKESDAALYVVFPTDRLWMLQAVPLAVGSFATRKPLPAAWGGLADGELAALTGVDEAVFAHANLFLAGAHTRAGALALAAIALVA